MDGPPDKIAIDHDDYHAEFVGHTADGRQFFLTTRFVPAWDGSQGCEFLALYLFDSEGKLLEARIDDLGPRASLDKVRRESLHERRLKELGRLSFGRIEVAPFATQRFGTTFGLVARPPDEDAEHWTVELEPGNYMAFFPPWDSGEYDT